MGDLGNTIKLNQPHAQQEDTEGTETGSTQRPALINREPASNPDESGRQGHQRSSQFQSPTGMIDPGAGWIWLEFPVADEGENRGYLFEPQQVVKIFPRYSQFLFLTEKECLFRWVKVGKGRYRSVKDGKNLLEAKTIDSGCWIRIPELGFIVERKKDSFFILTGLIHLDRG